MFHDQITNLVARGEFTKKLGHATGQRKQRTRRLEGVPVAVKNETLIKGMPCTSGSLLMRDYVADATSIDSQRILRAGGIVHARTATPEFSCAVFCHSKRWGVTRNPCPAW